MDLAKYQEETLPFEAKIAGETLSGTFYPARYDVAGYAKQPEGKTKKSVPITQADLLLSALASWDLTEGGEPLPITAENLARLGTYGQNEIVRAIGRAINPNGPEGNGEDES